MVRPRHGADREPVDRTDGRSDRTGSLRYRADFAAWREWNGESACAGPLRLRPETADAGDLAVGESELCRPCGHRSDFDYAFHRRQLAEWATHWPGIV